MNENYRDDRDLQDPESWDYEHAEARAPVKSARVVVSVAFRRDDFEIVSKYAERLRKKTSEFIREAAIEKATSQNSITYVQGFGSLGSLWLSSNLPSSTRASAHEPRASAPELVTLS